MCFDVCTFLGGGSPGVSECILIRCISFPRRLPVGGGGRGGGKIFQEEKNSSPKVVFVQCRFQRKLTRLGRLVKIWCEILPTTRLFSRPIIASPPAGAVALAVTVSSDPERFFLPQSVRDRPWLASLAFHLSIRGVFTSGKNAGRKSCLQQKVSLLPVQKKDRLTDTICFMNPLCVCLLLQLP